MNVLVTGANGFTGSHLARRLVEEGDNVRALVRRTADLRALKDLSLELTYGDLADDSSVDDAVRGAEIVYHVAAAYRTENIPRRTFWDVNVGGTRKLLEASARAGVKRFVHCSTVGVQGDIRNPPAKEEDPYAPGDYYQDSKRDGEILALEFHRQGKLPVSVVRPTGIYGPGDDRFLKLFRTIQKRRFFMIGSGEVLYHLTYIEDLVSGFLLAARRDEAIGEVFTIGGAEAVTLNRLVAQIAKTLGVPVNRLRIPVWPVWLAGLLCELICRPLRLDPPLYRRRVDFFVKERAFDISKARRLLGYEPRVPVEEGLRRTARWYREQGLLS